ncbi:MAG: MobV family relaxase [Bacteroidota bacterium]
MFLVKAELMKKSYCVLHIQAFKSVGRLGSHIDRLYVPQNADPARSVLNEEWAPRAAGSLEEDVQQRIAEGYTASRKLRKDARLALSVLMSGTHAQLKALEREPQQFQAWKAANYHFACQQFGEENIVRFAVHLDEKTPHIHCVVVPLTSDGRLSAKDYIGGRDYHQGKVRLRGYQEAYAQAMAPFGLSRGLPVERTQARHVPTAAYYRTMQELEQRVLAQTAAIKAGNVWKLSEVRAEIARTLSQAYQAAFVQQTKATRLTRDYVAEMAQSLSSVKRSVHLVQHVAAMGYRLREAGSTATHVCMEKGKEQLMVAKAPNAQGEWTYYALGDDEDRGTIVELMQRRGYTPHMIRQLTSVHLDASILREAGLSSPSKAQRHAVAQDRGRAL